MAKVTGSGLAVQVSSVVLVVCTVPSVVLNAAGVDPRAALSVVTVSTVLAAVAVFVWVRFRWSHPLEQTIRTAREFAHGTREARADELAGGREARFMAVALNRALAAANEHQCAPADVNQASIRSAVEQIERFGRGELAGPTAPLPGALAPVGYALLTAQQRLRERIEGLYGAAMVVAEGSAALIPTLRKTAEVVHEQHVTLSELTRGADEARDDALRIEPGLEVAVESVFLFGAEQRRSVHDIRDQLFLVARRARDARDATERARLLLAEASKVDRALRLMSGMSAPRSAVPKPEVVSATVGEATAAQGALRRELTTLREDLDGLSETIDGVVRAQPEPVADLDGRVAEPLLDLAAALVRALELSTGSVRNLSSGARRMRASIDEARKHLEAMGEQIPRLAVAVTEVGLETPFEAALLERLRRTKAEIEQLPPSGLTPAGGQMLAEVEAAAAAARARLAALVQTTESTLSVLRVG